MNCTRTTAVSGCGSCFQSFGLRQRRVLEQPRKLVFPIGLFRVEVLVSAKTLTRRREGDPFSSVGVSGRVQDLTKVRCREHAVHVVPACHG